MTLRTSALVSYQDLSSGVRPSSHTTRRLLRGSPSQPRICQPCRRAIQRTILLGSLQSPIIHGPRSDRYKQYMISRYSITSPAFFSTASRLRKDAERLEKSIPSETLADKQAAGSPSASPSQLSGQDGLDTTGDKFRKFVALARQSWHDVVGYSDIEKEKLKVEEQERTIEARRVELREARDNFRSAVDKHATSLREERDLLARRDGWSTEDASRFAQLHTIAKNCEQTENIARRAMHVAELGLEREIERLSSKIGAVYQAESTYNAKILQVKTFWTWALFLFNGSIFVFNLYLLQVGLNPRYKINAVDLSEKAIAKIAAISQFDPDETGIGDLSHHHHHQTVPTESLGVLYIKHGEAIYKNARFHLRPNEFVSSLKHRIQAEEGLALANFRFVLEGAELTDDQSLSDFDREAGESIEVFAAPLGPLRSEPLQLSSSDWYMLPSVGALKERTQKLFSDQMVTMQMKDMTAVALQSAFAGAVMAGLVVLNMRKG